MGMGTGGGALGHATYGEGVSGVALGGGGNLHNGDLEAARVGSIATSGGGSLRGDGRGHAVGDDLGDADGDESENVGELHVGCFRDRLCCRVMRVGG